MRNPVYEQALNKQGVNWRYEESVSLGDIDAAKGLRTQARLELPLDPELVESYRVADKAGDQFPPLVLWRPGKGRWIPVDGNQRLAAFTANKRKTTDAYIVENTDQLVIDRLTWRFNNLVNGKRNTPEEVMTHAITLVRKHGMTIKAAAEECEVSESKLGREVRVLDIRDKVEAQNVKVPSSLPSTSLDILGALQSAGDDVLAVGVSAAVKNGLDQNQCREIVNRVKAAKTQQEKVAAIVEYTKTEEVSNQRAQTKGGTVVTQTLPRDKLFMLVGQLSRLLAAHTDSKVLRPVPHAKYKTFRGEAEDVVNALILIAGLGAKLPKEETA